MKITLSEVKAGYAAIKKKAFSEYKHGNYEASLSYVDKAVSIASQIMWRYADNELEDLLSDISSKVIKQKQTNYKADKNKVVFYDYFGSTFILAIQYVKALAQLNFEILYIYEEQEWDLNVSVVEMMQQYPNVQVEIISKNINRIDKLTVIYNSILSFQPSKLFVHINTFSHCIPVLYTLPIELTKYYINLGDHAFWLGSKGIDYSFEFRNFGATVSYEKRGLKKEQLLLLPYYPIENGYEFQGFPFETRDKVVIFSGGDFYKMVDSQDTYWSLAKNMLEENPTSIILFANKILNEEGQKFLDNFIVSNNFEDRFIPIGFRPDINEVFAHCDIFMGTSPMSGGLMSQYAGLNSKPILQYYPKELFAFEETESMICFNKKIKISFTDKNEFLLEAKRLIDDSTYRKKRGQEINECMITEKQFNTLFEMSLETHISQVSIEKVNISYPHLEKWWLEVNNNGFSNVGRYIIGILGFNTFFHVPSLMIRYYLNRLSYKVLKK